MKDQVTEYAKAVVSGKILAPKKVIWACNRHLKDLEKPKNDKNFPYYWDIRESEKVIAFISSLNKIVFPFLRAIEINIFLNFLWESDLRSQPNTEPTANA